MDGSFSRFTSPAHQAPRDFRDLGLEQELQTFEAEWSSYVDGWTEMAITGNPWSNLNDAPRSYYYNPLEEGEGDLSPAVISWTPFPNRLLAFFSSGGASRNPSLPRALTRAEVMALADHGEISLDGKIHCLYDPSGGSDVLRIPASLCPDINWQGEYVSFSPAGPRGWLDEYCEWSITRDASGKIRSVMFTCENPAYYLALWRRNPKAVLGLYQKYIDPAVALEDLYLRYPDGEKMGKPVEDPTTGHPAYDVTNKWNRGTGRVPGDHGGAMHLTSGPNTLSAEIYLAAAATIARSAQVSHNAQTLICCAKYGQNFRNSDPHIGLTANRASSGSFDPKRLSLTDPVGLYIQQPTNFDQWRGPNGEDVSKYWRVTRGTAGTGPGGSDQILQAVFEVPESAGFSVNDVTINGQAVDYVGQIAETLNIALAATPKSDKQPVPQPNACVVPRTQGMQPWPVQLVPVELFYGLSPTDLPALLNPGSTNRLVLVVQGADKKTTVENSRVEFSVPGIDVRVLEFLPDASAIPGQTDGGGTQGFVMEIQVDGSVKPGPVRVRVLNPGEAASPSDQEHPWEAGLAVVPHENG